MRHYENNAWIAAPVEEVFDFIDDPKRLAGHMTSSTWMMGGGRMAVELDAGEGRTVGSHIAMSGAVCGLTLALDEVITHRAPPTYKAWSTVGEPRLIVLGAYGMGVEITRAEQGSHVRMFIDYALPRGSLSAVLGRLLGPFYARWCVGQMLAEAVRAFSSGHIPNAAIK